MKQLEEYENPFSDLAGCVKGVPLEAFMGQMPAKAGEGLEFGFEVTPEADESVRTVFTPGLMDKNLNALRFWRDADVHDASKDPAALQLGQRLLECGVSMTSEFFDLIRDGKMDEAREIAEKAIEEMGR